MASCNQLPVLPFDVLSEIFQVYVEGTQDSTQLPHNYLRSKDGPLLVSHICQYWRGVAFSTPKIWATLKIDPYLPYALISHFILLAGESPLTLYIPLGSYGINSNKKVLDLLLSRISQWRSLHIWIDEGIAKEILRRQEENCGGEENFASLCETSVLEELIIEGGFNVSPQISAKLLSFFLHKTRFPCLRRLYWSLDLSLFGSPYAYTAQDPKMFAWEKLKSLSFTSPPSFAVCLSLLQECKSLQSLRIDYRNTPSTYLYPYPGCLTPNASELAIPESLREFTIMVDKPVARGILTKFTKSFLGSSNLAIDVSA